MKPRIAAPSDLDELVVLRQRLWPDESEEEHRRAARAILAGAPLSTLPLVVFVADHETRPIGFVEVGLRSHADGCDETQPVGFIEGWYVEAEHRRRGVGRALIGAAEAWCREQGCREVASDTWADNDASQRAHVALGYEIVDRCVHFRKALPTPDPRWNESETTYYRAELARLHHEHFGMVARAAARELISRLSSSAISAGRVVDLAAGSGILSGAMLAAGFDVWGVDNSEEMLRIARAEASAATFVLASLWEVDLPPCVAVAAVGEAFSYAADPRASLSALEDRMGAIHRALAPGGLLLFDVASPGRSGPRGSRTSFGSYGDAYLGVEETEDGPGLRLTRAITIFRPQMNLHRRIVETHALRLYPPEDVEAVLTKVGFAWERLRRYDEFELMPGWHAWAAAK